MLLHVGMPVANAGHLRQGRAHARRQAQPRGREREREPAVVKAAGHAVNGGDQAPWRGPRRRQQPEQRRRVAAGARKGLAAGARQGLAAAPVERQEHRQAGERRDRQHRQQPEEQHSECLLGCKQHRQRVHQRQAPRAPARHRQDPVADEDLRQRHGPGPRDERPLGRRAAADVHLLLRPEAAELQHSDQQGDEVHPPLQVQGGPSGHRAGRHSDPPR
mmetsp:Transcript_37447/g.75557  ORF Transcript_37447/g.75557 Transcript_37447/m.75557 type:complete len:218 (-) Transcript_37447:360-1013(-)